MLAPPVDDDEEARRPLVGAGRHEGEPDYILTRWDEGTLQVKRTVHAFRRSGWDGPADRRDLSYRHAVSAEIVIPGG